MDPSMAAIKAKDSAPAIKNVPASSSFSIPVGKAKSNPKLPPFSSEVLDPITGKPLPHYLWPTASSCHDICKYGKRHGSLNPPAPRRLSEVRSESRSPSQLPSLSSSSSQRRCSSASNSPRHPSGKTPATPFTRTVSFGRTTIMKTSRPKERHPTITIPSKQRHPPAAVTTKDSVTAIKKTKIVSSTDSGSVTVSNTKKMVKDSDSSNVQEDKIQDKTMIVEEVHGSQGEESEHEVPLESPADIPPSQEQTTITISTVNEHTETEETIPVATDEQYKERESFTVENSPTTSSLKVEHPLSEQPQQDHYNEGATDIKPDVADDVDAPKDLVDASMIEKEREGAEKEENEDKQDKQEEEEEKEAENEENEEKQEEQEVEEINDSSYDEYSEDDDSEPDDDEEEEPNEIQEIGAEQRPTVKPRAQRDGIRKIRGEEGKDDALKKLKFRRGTVLSPKAEEDANKPKKLRFRRDRVIDKQEDGQANSSSRQRRSFNRQEEEKKDDTDSAKVKKDSPVVFNQVIEQTASKLVESRKSKVKALVGAFETVISIHETDAQTSQGHSHA